MAFSLFKSLSDLYNKFTVAPNTGQLAGSNMYVAEVVDVIVSKTHALYESDFDIGKVLLRELYIDSNIPDEEIKRTAYPLDRTLMRMPLPGEFVVVLRGIPGNFEQDVRIVPRDYYINVVPNLSLLNYNGVPFGAVLPSRVSKTLGTEGLSFLEQLKERHKTRFNSFIERQIKSLRPYDGDYIMQGRFGNSIRLGSTVSSPSNPNAYGSIQDTINNTNANINKSTWSEEGVSGDPIIIMRTAKVDNIAYDANTPTDIFAVEDINQDGSSLYLCENQKVSIQLQIANNGFKTWMKDLGIKPVSNTTTVNDSVKQKPAGVEFPEDNDVSQNSTNQTQRSI